MNILNETSEYKTITLIKDFNKSKVFEVPKLHKLFKIIENLGRMSLDVWADKNFNGPDDETDNFVITNWDIIYTQCDSLKLLKIYNYLELKNYPPIPCMTINISGELCLYIGRSKKNSYTYVLIDLAKDCVHEIDPDVDFLKIQDIFIETNNELRISLTREPKEAIIVILDLSLSMNQKYNNSESLNKIGAAKACFNAFAERTMAYDFPHVICLISLEEIICDFTEIWDQFKRYIDKVNPYGETPLYDTMKVAVEKLKEFGKVYPNCLKRMICLTDGEDTVSVTTAVEIARLIQQNQIVLDTFMIGENNNHYESLKLITLSVGGYCYSLGKFNDEMRLFECETILSASIRSNLNKTEENVKRRSDLAKFKNLSYTKHFPEIKLPKQLTK